jgi:uncharacterized membrane protein YagU involved in acid resistance
MREARHATAGAVRPLAPVAAVTGGMLAAAAGTLAMDLVLFVRYRVNNLTHWGYGIMNGVPFGILVGSARSPRLRYGALFGGAVWATSYAVLPAAHLYQPIWKYDARTLGRDLSAHLVYGFRTATVFKLLSARTRTRS